LASNKRVIYSSKGLAIKKSAAIGGLQDLHILPLSASGVNPSGIWEVPRGVQSVSISTTFNLEQVFQQGQLAIYENVEDRPDIEMTINRVLDGTQPLYLMASDDGGEAAGARRSLNARNASYQNEIALHVYPEANVHASGTPDARTMASGMYLSSVSYTFPVDGSATEEISFVGNNKFWDAASGGTAPVNLFPSTSGLILTDEDAATITPGANPGVTRREDFDISASTLPTIVPSADRSAIQNVTISADLGREEIFALGTKDAYHRSIQFPLEVTCSFECITSEGDLIEARADQDNLTNQTIILKTKQGLTVDLGTKNKLASIDFSGGDTGGGEVSVTYNFTNFNDLFVSHVYYP